MIEIMNGGLYSTIQDYPGRVGYWDVGVPPSGPMDPLAFRIANSLVGNPEGEAGLEMTGLGPKLSFQVDGMIALTGAKMKGTLNGNEVPWWEPVYVRKGSILALQCVDGEGFRSYLAVRGGFDVPAYLGSTSTFPFGAFGGYQGRPLKPGDILQINKTSIEPPNPFMGCRLKAEFIPEYHHEWEIGVLPGPHGAPDLFTCEDEEMFYSTAWKVHYNSNRLGYRLEGPSPSFARLDGGEGGRHPSNMLDYTYAVGTVNFTGNMPIILTADGPSLGGFVSFATIVTAELWKVGQAKPHDMIRFKKISLEEALDLQRRQNRLINGVKQQ